MRCARQVRPAVTDDFASTAAAELLQKSDEIVGDASIADKARQSPTLLRARASQKFASPLTLCSLVRICLATTYDRSRRATFGPSRYPGNATRVTAGGIT